MASITSPIAVAGRETGCFSRFRNQANSEMDRIVHQAFRLHQSHRDQSVPLPKSLLRLDCVMKILPNVLPLRVAAFCEDIGKILPDADLIALQGDVAYADASFGEKQRISGERYIVHPLAVAEIFGIEWGLPLLNAIKAMLLHDTPEDTTTTLQEIRDKYGDEVAEIVDGMTKVRSTYEAKDVTLAKTYRKIINAMRENVIVGLGKIADRLNNMRTLSSMPVEKRIRISQETLDVYVPIAKALGMMDVAAELERIAFRYLYPAGYEKIEAWICNNGIAVQEKRFERFLSRIRNIAAQFRGSVKIVPRTSWELFKLCRASGLELNKIIEIETPLVRIVLPDVARCYRILPEIYQITPPCHSTFRDCISFPNGFHQALEVWVRAWSAEEETGILRLEILPEDRERLNRIGILGLERDRWQATESLWLGNLASQVEELPESDRVGIVEAIQQSNDEFAAYSPHGAQFLLPTQASAGDFAFGVHQQVGITASEAIVFRRDGVRNIVRRVGLKEPLGRGSIVWVVTQEGIIPDFRLLLSLKSPESRKKMRNWMERATALGAELSSREEIFQKVEAAINSELKPHFISLDQILGSDDICATLLGRLNSSFRGEVLLRVEKGEAKRVALVVTDKSSLLRSIAMGFVRLSLVVEEFKRAHEALCLEKSRIYFYGRIRARIKIFDQPGELAKIFLALGSVGANIAAFNQPQKRGRGPVVSSVLVQFYSTVQMIQILNILRENANILQYKKTNPIRKSKSSK